MKKHWFRDRLIPKKQQSGMWTDLSDSIEMLITDHVESIIERLRDRVSIFDMHHDDLKILLSEMGKFFVVGDVADDDAALVLMQREDEIHLKRTIYPLVNTINREFEGLSVKWQPQWAAADLDKYPYPSVLKDKKSITDDINTKLSEWFLSSRGAIAVNFDEIEKMFSDSRDPMETLEGMIKKIILPLIPLRIVCDGIRFNLPKLLIENQSRDLINEPVRMDIVKCDGLPVDYEYILTEW